MSATMPPGKAVLIAAFSGRALAASARRAGFVPLVADLFADADTEELAGGLRQVDGSLGGGFDAVALLAALEALAAGRSPLGVVYGAGFEDRPELLAAIGERWRVLGNSPEAVARLKSPEAFAAACGALGIPHPEISREAPAKAAAWLRKRCGGAGGAHISRAAEATAAGSASHYFQRRVGGRSVSALFVAARDGARIIGFSEQWRAPTAAEPFRFGGALRPARLGAATEAELSEAVLLAARAFGLVGLNSADFMLGDDGGWWLLEINPRPGATLDIFDNDANPLLALHVAAVIGSALPTVPKVNGSAIMQILYTSHAKCAVQGLQYPVWIADRPRTGASLAADAPFCTVLASGETVCEAENLCAERAKYWQNMIEEYA